MTTPGGALAFVTLEFSHSIGVPVGTYPAGADVLQIAVAETRAATRGPRRRAVPDVEAGAPVALSLATLVLVRDGPLDAEGAARWLDRHARDGPRLAALVDRALGVLNRALRAARHAMADPYLVEVTRADPRAVRVGCAAPEEIRRGLAPGHAVKLRRAGSPPRKEVVRVGQEVAEALAGRLTAYESEELALRSLLDAAHGRPRAAAAGARAAAQLLGAELGEPTAEVRPDGDAAGALAEDVLRRISALRAAELERLRAHR